MTMSQQTSAPTSANLTPSSPNLGHPPPPLSFISSRITDIASEDGGSPISQPPWAQSSQSRRGPPPTRSSIISQANQGANRPQSSASRMSRTHVPSLASHAFFRPMSSQRLQAQRSGRRLTNHAQVISTEDGQSDMGSHPRNSFISTTTARQGLVPYENELPPPSRGTEFTDPVIIDRTTTASPTGNTTVRSMGDSVRLLHDRTQRAAPQQLNLGDSYRTDGAQEQPQRSPLSFRSGFLKPNNPQDDRDPRGHERLSSAASTPHKVEGGRPNADLGRNYEYFPGNTIFFAGGRLQNTRDRPVNIATGLLILLPTGLFYGYSGPWLWRHISPAIPIVFAYLFFTCFSSFLHASLVDPGIYPRNLHQMPPDPDEDPLTLGPPMTDRVKVKSEHASGITYVPVKYCRTCNIWRPPRCYHCRVCDNCVETLDHHCVWLNNCVGRRNYRYFFSFIGFATILALFLLGASLTHILVYRTREGITFRESIDRWRVPFAMVIYGALAALYPASLWGYHFFLMGRGETTREYLLSKKLRKAVRYRPYSQGNFLKNWIAVLGRPRPPTYLEFKKPYIQGDQRLAPTKRKMWRRDVEAQSGEIEMHTMSARQQSFEGPAGRGTLPGVQPTS
ncbi:hypothetical protein VTO42DRAFT_1624 [Malbranchea cinnamomea]